MRMLPDHTLRIEGVESGDAGTYICVATNVVGTTEAVADLTVECKLQISLDMYLVMFGFEKFSKTVL